MNEFKIIAKTFQGLEEVLAKELTELGANNIEIGRRMVSFTGDKEMLYKANFCLRTAVKILKPIKEFKASDADEVYEIVKKMDWAQFMECSNTFLVDSVVFSEKFRHSKFVAYRVKDAIADYWREKTNGERPNVAITNPDIRINVHIAEDDVTISLDSSGESLHIRGYKTNTVAAPINEVLAAGMIMLTGWNGECDLIDPFCGSGTILIEAALIAMNIYPGVFRKEYAFEKWKDFDEDMFDAIYNDDSQERDFDHKIYGFDINRQAVGIAIENARNAGVNKVVDIEQRDFYEFEAPREKAIMITNPPYGERITTDDLLGLYETIGQRLKQNFVGNDAWIITYRQECFDKIGFRPSTRYALFNGSLECEFRKYQIFDGKLKERREEGYDIKTEEERARNLKFKPHKKHDEDSEEEERKERDSHYFKSKPYKDERRKKEEEREKQRHSKDETREDRFASRKRFFEAADEEEEEIINRHIGKWSDKGYNREEKRRDREDRQKGFGDKKNYGDKKSYSDKGERKSFNPNFQKRDGKRPGGKFDESKGKNRQFRDRDNDR
ncbi:MAG: methyltransferase [Bacteroidaceae bacterium]|nr:methyltransferase [Bacteroidaceae bacterium]